MGKINQYDKYLVSVIVPIYNVEKYLNVLLDSVLSQNYTNLEVLLINDGSTDSSLEICNEYAEKDERIQIINKKNEGPSETRNLGIDNSKGDFIMFLDSDDYIHPDMISRMINSIVDDDSDICICNVERITKEKKRIQCTKILPRIINFNNQEKSEYIIKNILSEDKHKYSIWNRLFKASIIKSNNIKFINYSSIISEDMLFNINTIIYANRISWVQEPLYKHFIRAGALTMSPKPDILKRAIKQIEFIGNIIKDQCDLLDAYPYISLKILNMAIDYSIFHNNDGFIKFKKELEIINNISNKEKLVDLINKRMKYSVSLDQYVIIKMIKFNINTTFVLLFYFYKKARYSIGCFKRKSVSSLLDSVSILRTKGE